MNPATFPGSEFFDSGIFTWVVVPFLIFRARALDVTLMTVRIITLSRGFIRLRGRKRAVRSS